MFDQNVSVLKKVNPSLLFEIENTKIDNQFQIMESKRGDSVLFYNDDGKKKYFNSKVDPYREAERFTKQIDNFDFDMFVIFGFGAAYHIESLLQKISQSSILVIVEKELSIIKLMMIKKDLTKIFSDKRVILLVDPKDDIIAEYLKGKSTKKTTFLMHRGSYQVFPDYYNNISVIVKSYLSTKDVNIATLAKFEKIWSSNLARNIKSFASSLGVDRFYNKFKSYDAILVAAGPSLNQSLNFIRENRSKAIIVAVDTAYKTLLNNNIVPHFVLAVDPQIINARYFEGVEKTTSILVVDPTVHPSVVRMFKGRILFTSVAFDMLKWIEKIIGTRGEITHGGSVSTNCYDFAKRLGVGRVVMVGQDLSFTHGLAHAKGSYLDEQIHMKTFRFKNSEMFNRSQLTALPKIFVPSIHDKKVHTNQKLLIFLSWFEKRKDKFLINSTKDGAKIPSVTHIDDQEIEFENHNKNIELFIDTIYENEKLINFDSDLLFKKIVAMNEELDELIPQLKSGVAQSNAMVEIIKSNKNDQGKLNYILKKLSEIDKRIESKKTLKEIISITTQKVIHTITEGYDINGITNNEENNDLIIAKKSLFLYEGLLDGAKFNSKILSKMLIMLKEN